MRNTVYNRLSCPFVKKRTGLVGSNQKAVNYLLKKDASGGVVAEIDGAILRYAQLTNMTLQRFANDVIDKSRKVADVYDDSTFTLRPFYKLSIDHNH